MTTNESAPAKAAESKAKELTVANDMDARRMFNNVEDAAAYLSASAEKYADFGAVTLAAPGIDSEGNFDPDVYAPGMQVMVAKLMRLKTPKNPTAGVKALVVVPVPSLEQFMANELGKAWVERIIQKELNHVAVRPLREAKDVDTVIDQIPTTMEQFISSARGEGGGIMDTYKEMFKKLIDSMAKLSKVWEKARLTKSELQAAYSSKAYAMEYYPALENRGDKPSLFVMSLQTAIVGAKAKGLDPTIFERWLETRDAKPLAGADAEEGEEEIDEDALALSLMEDTPAKPATEGEAETDAESTPPATETTAEGTESGTTTETAEKPAPATT